MEKHFWKRIDKNSSKPCPRWGHACCVVEEQIVFFGGYADSNYMNDMWTYNAITMEWNEIHTTGERPSHRSNCSMNYDPINHTVVVFGGGGPNKQRFNSVSVLDWPTKHWVEIRPKENEVGPWERTYHVAQLKFPYLVVFGGEGVSDLDDTWYFNFKTHDWRQIKFDQQLPKPCARRFHSSCAIGNQIFVVAGCHGKYRCLSDVWSLDISPLLESGSVTELKWKERKLKNSSFLTRWGHSTAAYNGKIYVFAGRFSNDLNDLLVIDPIANTLKGLKIGSAIHEQPKPRRRHSAGFVGSCMISFGGFNGEYFNDLHYINVFELAHKLEVTAPEKTWASLISNEEFADGMIYSNTNKPFPIHYGLIARHISCLSDFGDYMTDVNHHYSDSELTTLLTTLYKGYGALPQDEITRKFGLKLPLEQNRRHLLNLMLESEKNERNLLKLASQQGEKSNEMVISLDQSDFATFLHTRRNQWFSDVTLELAEHKVRVNRLLLGCRSSYFNYLLSESYLNQQNITVCLPPHDPIIMDTLLNFVMMGVVVVPSNFTTESWMEMAELADYFCMADLLSICENQLCIRLNADNHSELQHFSHRLSLKPLSLHCANFQLHHSLKTKDLKKKVSKMRDSQQERNSSFMQLYQTLHFDLLHNNQVEPFLKMKKNSQSETMIEEKENNREYTNV